MRKALFDHLTARGIQVKPPVTSGLSSIKSMHYSIIIVQSKPVCLHSLAVLYSVSSVDMCIVFQPLGGFRELCQG